MTEVLPSGTATFLFTDEGSTRLWDQHPEAMSEAHALHARFGQSLAYAEVAEFALDAIERARMSTQS